jgi:hemerythrin
MPSRTPWTPAFATGHGLVDAQHRELLARCDRLADGDEAGSGFDEAFERLKTLVREHLDAEATLLAALGDPDADDLRTERDEFEHLAAEILTTANFDRVELQRFVALWCVAHVTDSAARLRPWLPGGDAAAPAAPSR